MASRKAVFQVGSQQRSDTLFQQAVEIVRNGLIGMITRVEVGLPTGHDEPEGDATVKTPPADLNYDLWCGPSVMLPYMEARHHWSWRWTLAYGGGQLMDWIGHHNDIAHWGLGMDKSGPISVEAKNCRVLHRCDTRAGSDWLRTVHARDTGPVRCHWFRW